MVEVYKADMSPLHQVALHTSSVRGLVTLPDNTIIALSPEGLSSFTLEGGPARKWDTAISNPTSFDITSTWDTLAVALPSGRVAIVDIASQSITREIPVAESDITCVAFDGRAIRLAICTQDT